VLLTLGFRSRRKIAYGMMREQGAGVRAQHITAERYYSDAAAAGCPSGVASASQRFMRGL
jgi:hypothetical protein